MKYSDPWHKPWHDRPTAADVIDAAKLIVFLDRYDGDDGRVGNEIPFPKYGRIGCTADAQSVIMGAHRRRRDPDLAGVLAIIDAAIQFPLCQRLLLQSARETLYAAVGPL